MFAKDYKKLKTEAIKLRKQGQTYSEILDSVHVSKSTLSLWLREVGLSKHQKQRITEKKLASMERGAKRKREIRIEKTDIIFKKSSEEIKSLSRRDLWLMGTMLYWAEGAKEKKYRTSVGLDFANSDFRMIKLYVIWLTDILKVDWSRIVFSLYIHETGKGRMKDVVSFWSKHINLPHDCFGYVYYKKHKPKTKRKNTGHNYFGMVRVKVRASTDLNRKVAGWIDAIHKEYSGVV